MALSAAELQALKDLESNLADKILPEVLQAEMAKLPAAYVAFGQILESAVWPAIQAKIDAYIAAQT